MEPSTIAFWLKGEAYDGLDEKSRRAIFGADKTWMTVSDDTGNVCAILSAERNLPKRIETIEKLLDPDDFRCVLADGNETGDMGFLPLTQGDAMAMEDWAANFGCDRDWALIACAVDDIVDKSSEEKMVP